MIYLTMNDFYTMTYIDDHDFLYIPYLDCGIESVLMVAEEALQYTGC